MAITHPLDKLLLPHQPFHPATPSTLPPSLASSASLLACSSIMKARKSIPHSHSNAVHGTRDYSRNRDPVNPVHGNVCRAEALHPPAHCRGHQIAPDTRMCEMWGLDVGIAAPAISVVAEGVDVSVRSLHKQRAACACRGISERGRSRARGRGLWGSTGSVQRSSATGGAHRNNRQPQPTHATPYALRHAPKRMLHALAGVPVRQGPIGAGSIRAHTQAHGGQNEAVGQDLP